MNLSAEWSKVKSQIENKEYLETVHIQYALKGDTLPFQNLTSLSSPPRHNKAGSGRVLSKDAYGAAMWRPGRRQQQQKRGRLGGERQE